MVGDLSPHAREVVSIRPRTDNCVKNHFYSRLRKSLRKVNGAIQATMKKMYRPLQMNTIYKIVEATEEMFRDEPCCSLATSQACKGEQILI